MPLVRLREFVRLEAAGGIVLMFAAGAALLIANSPLGAYYVDFLMIPGSVQVGSLVVSKPLLLWVNDLWMAVFLFLVGLEIKREAWRVSSQPKPIFSCRQRQPLVAWPCLRWPMPP